MKQLFTCLLALRTTSDAVPFTIAHSFVSCILYARFTSLIKAKYLCVCAGGLVTQLLLGLSIALLHHALDPGWLALRHPLMPTQNTMMGMVALQTFSSYMQAGELQGG